MSGDTVRVLIPSGEGGSKKKPGEKKGREGGQAQEGC
jgi:hypothetical protein